MSVSTFIVPLSKAGIRDVEYIGSRSVSLGEMIRHLSKLGINIPSGFVITAQAYKHFLLSNDLEPAIRKHLCAINHDNMESLRRESRKIRRLIMNAEFSPELEEQLIIAYKELSDQYQVPDAYVALYSSAVTEEDPDALFTTQQQVYQNVRGLMTLTDTIKGCFAALFTEQAISNRHQLGYRHFNMGLSVCVQKMVRPGMASSGMAFSVDSGRAFTKAVVINGTHGAGGLISSQVVSPDEYIVLKSTLQELRVPIIEKKLGVKDNMIIYGDNPYEKVTVIPTDKNMQARFCLSDDQVLTMAGWVTAIEKYAHEKGYWFPLNIEWAIDARSNQLFVVEVSRRPFNFTEKVALPKFRMIDANKMVYTN